MEEQFQRDVSFVRKATPLICVILTSWVVFQTLGIGVSGLENAGHQVDPQDHADAFVPGPAQPPPVPPEAESSPGNLAFPALPTN